MSDFVQNLWATLKAPLCRDWILQTSIIFFHYPNDLIRTLQQIGYQPFPPSPGPSITSIYIENLNIPLFYYPSKTQYLKYIRSVDGFWGVYRGVLPFICANSVSYFVTSWLSIYREKNPLEINLYSERINLEMDQAVRIVRHLSISGNEDDELDELENQEFGRFRSEQAYFWWDTCWKVVSANVGLTVAHPFFVIAVRQSAQFIGRENIYNSIIGSIIEIFKKEGISGFFKGLVPRLISRTIDVVLTSLAYFVVKKIFDEDVKKPGFKSHVVAILAGLYTYFFISGYGQPFAVASSSFIVNNTGLAIGSSPHSKTYSSWLDTFRSISASGQIHRGESRLYQGPFTLSNGLLVPTHYFGPTHPAGLGFASKIK